MLWDNVFDFMSRGAMVSYCCFVGANRIGRHINGWIIIARRKPTASGAPVVSAAHLDGVVVVALIHVGVL